MTDEVFLVLILPLLAGISILSVWGALRLGSYGRTQPARPPPNARPTRTLEDTDADLIAKLRRVRYAKIVTERR